MPADWPNWPNARSVMHSTRTRRLPTWRCSAPPRYSEARQAAEIADPLVDTWLVDDAGGTPVAFLQIRMGVADEAPHDETAVELSRFYVSRDWHGRGVAHAMMALVFDRARANGADCVWLGVWEHNERAKAFYAKCGFTVYGEHAFVLGTDRQRDLLMRAPVPFRTATPPPA